MQIDVVTVHVHLESWTFFLFSHPITFVYLIHASLQYFVTELTTILI
jgi:hypothetical protein